jgi:RNA polymerase sigma-70 factor (ECF subfamily)
MDHDPAGGSDQSLRALFNEARRAQGELATPYEVFCARVAPLLADGESLSAERASDIFLACACEAGDVTALDQFELHFIPAARAAIAKVTSSEDAVDEAVQELRRRLFVGPTPRIRAYSGSGPLWKWLRVTATRTAHDLRRAQGTLPAAGDDVVERLLSEDVDPEFRLVRQRYEAIFREALREALQTLTAQERTLLRLRYIQDQGIDSLAVPFQAHRATVARWLQTIRGKILAHVHRRLETHIPRLTETEAKSLWRAVRSQVHLSFARLVDDDGADP